MTTTKKLFEELHHKAKKAADEATKLRKDMLDHLQDQPDANTLRLMNIINAQTNMLLTMLSVLSAQMNVLAKRSNKVRKRLRKIRTKNKL